MKLIVQIPCFNEQATIEQVIGSIPRQIDGVDQVEVLVIDDGSTDGTADTARQAGADHLLCLSGNRGLARAFAAGIDACLAQSADIIVNTDGDNQYNGQDIPALIQPILDGRADITIGDRALKTDPQYPAARRLLQQYGSMLVRLLSNTQVPDATSGFRAYSRDAALRLNVVSDFTYTLETIIQAGQDRLKIQPVRISTNPRTRPSRLFGSVPEYLRRSADTLVRVYAMYKPLAVFGMIGGALFTAGSAIGLWFIYYYLTQGGRGHVQLLILAATLIIVGFQVLMIGLLADLIAANRKLIQDALLRIRRIETDQTKKTDPKSD